MLQQCQVPKKGAAKSVFGKGNVCDACSGYPARGDDPGLLPAVDYVVIALLTGTTSGSDAFADYLDSVESGLLTVVSRHGSISPRAGPVKYSYVEGVALRKLNSDDGLLRLVLLYEDLNMAKGLDRTQYVTLQKHLGLQLPVYRSDGASKAAVASELTRWRSELPAMKAKAARILANQASGLLFHAREIRKQLVKRGFLNGYYSMLFDTITGNFNTTRKLIPLADLTVDPIAICCSNVDWTDRRLETKLLRALT